MSLSAFAYGLNYTSERRGDNGHYRWRDAVTESVELAAKPIERPGWDESRKCIEEFLSEREANFLSHLNYGNSVSFNVVFKKPGPSFRFLGRRELNSKRKTLFLSHKFRQAGYRRNTWYFRIIMTNTLSEFCVPLLLKPLDNGLDISGYRVEQLGLLDWF